MDRMLSSVPKDRLRILEAAGFTWQPFLAVWCNRDRRKIISYDAVRKRDGTWLNQWIAEDVSPRETYSVWFEQPLSPDDLQVILSGLGW